MKFVFGWNVDCKNTLAQKLKNFDLILNQFWHDSQQILTQPDPKIYAWLIMNRKNPTWFNMQNFQPDPALDRYIYYEKDESLPNTMV